MTAALAHYRGHCTCCSARPRPTAGKFAHGRPAAGGVRTRPAAGLTSHRADRAGPCSPPRHSCTRLEREHPSTAGRALAQPRTE